MMGVLFVFLATMSAVLGQSCDSSSGWYGDKDLGVCYSLGKLTSGETDVSQDFFEGEAYCEDLDDGTRLATIRTQPQQDFIRSNLIGTNIRYLWTSGNDLAHEGTWEWGFNTGDLVVYSAWYSNQPNGGEGEDCIVMENTEDDEAAGYSFLWHDYSCETTGIYPLCERTPA